VAFLTDDKELYDLQDQGKTEAQIWRQSYPEFERLADNDLLEDGDESLPEVNDGSLSASLFKLPKRIVSSDLTGRATATDSDDAWVTELANIVWEKKIIPNANSQAPFHRKWKDAVRKAAIYGSVPLITLFVERGRYTGADFVVAQPQDVTLEPGKVSDYDSDVLFWDVYFSRSQVKDMIKRAKAESKEARDNPNDESFNKWSVEVLNKAYNSKEEASRDVNDEHSNKKVQQKGIKFCIAVQRGVDAPFKMFWRKETAREWSNPDPSGDVNIHYLYCYQDFVNPYGTGIVKLAGGTQNVLDYMRKADVLATQIGLRPPVSIAGDLTNADLDSIGVYAQDAQWITGEAVVRREEISNQVYAQLPARVSMYKTSLNQLIPTGDTSIGGSDSGDPQYSKTPAGVAFQKANLSIDDEDFKDNLYMTYEAVAKSMINTHFANMQGSDLLKLTDEERDRLIQAGLEFPVDEKGNPTNELEVIWDEARATFDFEINAEQSKTTDEAQQLEGLMKVMDLIRDPATQQMLSTGQPLMLGTMKLDPGELISEIINLTTDNDKIITQVTPEEEEEQLMNAQMAEQQMMQQPIEGEVVGQPQEQLPEPSYLDAVMAQFNVDAGTAMAMLAAEEQGYHPEEILEALERNRSMA
jgi:hypothetical protein